ncbi:MAG TPA: hypothetical protein VK894_12060 [Jiangellales bacterium]|nr:hypothetical protein [Jiangellales bacterium]
MPDDAFVDPATARVQAPTPGPYPSGPCSPGHPAHDPDRLRARAVFLRELAEARELLARATPWRTRGAQLRARMRQTTFRV